MIRNGYIRAKSFSQLLYTQTPNHKTIQTQAIDARPVRILALYPLRNTIELQVCRSDHYICLNTGEISTPQEKENSNIALNHFTNKNTEHKELSMSVASSAAFKSIGVLLACAIYMEFYGGPHAAANDYRFIPAEGALNSAGRPREPELGNSTLGGANSVGIYKLAQFYLAVQVLLLYILPFWNLFNQRFRLTSFIRDCAVHWTLSFFIYYGVLIIKQRFGVN
ncbi:hypothetical protein SAMD00023353_1701030 [Rosellinia necatrix]|uniref:Uncharacterized protein n=1 Tax=Rosellinia necatrix TaxID=77044 RepID=A0A1W2TKM9_ROSNE|nr:hypothetical protein SAMD00023353_1701030 [Rosellinia necatrix]